MTKIGLIGCGRWGLNHAKVLSEMKECKFVGMADVSLETEKVAKQFKTEFFQNYKDMLPLVDAISIVTPTDTHHKIVKDCLMAKKHVIVEKPITSNSKEAEELVDLAKKENLVLAVGYLFRFNNSVVKLKSLLKEVGDINYITARYIHSTNPPRKDSGVIFNFGSHLIDILNFVLEKRPKKIFCKKTNYLSKEREDFAEILLDYGDFTACIEVSWLHPLKKRDMWIIGSKKKIYADFLDQKIESHLIEIGLDKTTSFGCKNIIVVKNEPLRDELKHFIECIKNAKEPINSGKEGAGVTKLCNLALKSAKSGNEVRV
jgi:UDP-N-acetylglucosamine 3-dehydrogenase